MAGRIAVVDARDRFLRWADRAEVHAERLVHRSAHVFVFDRAPRDGGRLWIQRRHPAKDTYPDHWDGSCAGHVEECDYPGGPDEDLDRVYREVARRELQEELGITPDELSELGHFEPRPDVHYEQLRLFLAISAGPFVLQPDEVTAVRSVSAAELEALVEEEPVTGTLVHLGRWLRARGHW